MSLEKYFLVYAILHVGWAARHNLGIIGGHQVSIEHAPYMASLRLNGTYHWCGGSIIHEKFILTAAHCIKPNREFKILVGNTNIDGKSELFEIDEIKIHKDFNNETFDYDVCLIKLKKPLTFGPKVAKVTLADGLVKLKSGAMLNVTGWGSNGIDPVTSKLFQVQIPLVLKRACQMKYLPYKKRITSHMICAGAHGHDSCQGDSGGPLTTGNVQVGVTSFGLGCGMVPGVYSRVSSVLPWIMEELHLYQ